MTMRYVFLLLTVGSSLTTSIQVSPYNLWSVRILAGVSIALLSVGFAWWLLLLVSTFANPPAVNFRGSGFLAFSYATLTLVYLGVVGKLFFAIPSKSATLYGSTLTGLLVVDLCIILAVRQIRVEEGWVGIVSVAWATLVATYAIVQNGAVARGIKEEEERLTGREETRRTLREWAAVMTETVILTVAVIATLLLTVSLILRAVDASLAAPGEKYYVHGDRFQVHLACVGNDSSHLPTILLEGDHDPVERSFQPFIDNSYQHGRYCYWDRPGFGWSDNAPSPFSAGMASDALTEALSQADEQGPWILVSAGIGGIYSRIFASRNLPQVSGILLIDSLHEDYLGASGIGSARRGFLLWLRGVLSPLGISRLAGAVFRGHTRRDRIVGRSAHQGEGLLKAELQESLVATSITMREVQTARRVGSDIPLVVVSSGIEVGKSEKWARKQEDLQSVTDHLVAWDVVDEAPHEVWQTGRGRQVVEKRLRDLVERD